MPIKEDTMGKNEGSFKEFYSITTGLVPEFKGFIIIRVFMSILYEALKLIPLYIVKIIIDIVVGAPEINKIVPYILAMFGILILLAIIDVISYGHIFRKVGEFQSKILKKIHQKLLHLPLSFHEKQSTGLLVSKINKAATYMHDITWFTANDITPTIVQIVLTSAMLLYIKWEIGIIYLISLPLIINLILKASKKSQPYRQQYHRLFDNASSELAQAMYNIKTVKDYTQEDNEHKSYKNILKSYAKKLVERWNLEMWLISFRESLTNAVRILNMFIAVWFVIKGTLTAGDLVLVFTLTEKAFLNVHRLGRLYSLLGDAHESLTNANDILKESNEIETPKNPITPKTKQGLIEFKDVNFSYGSEEVLKKVNINIPSKKIIAIIGESGSGKSTLIKLITRHYDPVSGSVLLDNIDLKKMSLNSLRKRIATVSQHTEIFNRTIHENIAYGKPSASRKEVITAAKKARAHEFIMSFENKYKTLVGEKGVRLSGGQQQRISIARALLSNPEILIFDEATSSLDSESEIKIQEALLSTRGKYTMIVIAHRLSTVEHADLVIVMDKGRIAELGEPKRLLKKKGSIYKRMIKLQKLGELRS